MSDGFGEDEVISPFGNVAVHRGFNRILDQRKMVSLHEMDYPPSTSTSSLWTNLSREGHDQMRLAIRPESLFQSDKRVGLRFEGCSPMEGCLRSRNIPRLEFTLRRPDWQDIADD